MRQMYGMDALNMTHKHLKISKMKQLGLENLYKEGGWATLSQRRHQHKLSFMYNVNTGMVPSYIQDLIPPG